MQIIRKAVGVLLAVGMMLEMPVAVTAVRQDHGAADHHRLNLEDSGLAACGTAGSFCRCTPTAVGTELPLYPAFSDWRNEYRQFRSAAEYVRQAARLDDESYDAIWRSARDYNRALLQHAVQIADYKSQLVVPGSDVMGCIAIPELEITLPIRRGTVTDSAGHLEWSSLPVGGEGSHCVLTGVPGDGLEEGDVFLLYILDEVLTYEVDRIQVVEQDDVEQLQITPGKDYCTLISCDTNSQWLLVRGRRVEE